MNRTRRVLMVALVATALTADRLAAAAPVLRPTVTQGARSFAGRLVVSLRRTIPAARLSEFRAAAPAVPAPTIQLAADSKPIRLFAFSPFQFRLPPPAL